jgi:hypothetical protein
LLGCWGVLSFPEFFLFNPTHFYYHALITCFDIKFIITTIRLSELPLQSAMGALVSRSKFLVATLMIVGNCEGNGGAGTAQKPISIVIGLAGAGKSTIIGNVCEVDLYSDNGIFAATQEEKVVDCGDQILVDTCGLQHLKDKDAPVENAFHDGLERLLSFMDGKSIGRIYVVTSSSHMRDTSARVLEQVDFLKSFVNPMIPWTAVINCFEGICPSTLDPKRVPKFFSALKEKTDDNFEISSPHLQPVDKTLFRAPSTIYSIDLPADWRERIKPHDIAGIRENMKAKAIAACQAHQSAFLAASNAIKDHVCTLEECPTVNCAMLAACPDSVCTIPRCGNNDQCRTSKTTTHKEYLGLSKSTTTEEGTDVTCIDAITQCNTARAKACDKQLEVITECNNERSAQCLKHKDSSRECNTKRTDNCVVELSGVVASNSASMEKHKPYVDACQKFYTMK